MTSSSFKPGRLLLLFGLVVACVFACAGVASAASYTVTDQNDAPLANPSDTNCASTDGGQCTLRAAVQASDNSGGTNTITVNPGNYKLTIPAACPSASPTASSRTGCDANDPSRGDLDVTNGNQLTITGAGSGSTTLNGNNLDRVFAVQHGAALTLGALTLTKGLPQYTNFTYTCGSGSCNGSSYYGSGNACGGGIYNDGGLTVNADTVLAQNSDSDFCHDGGAIYSESSTGDTLAVNGSAAAPVIFSGNTAEYGGAIYYDSPATVTISHAQFNNNVASDWYGGAIDVYNGTLSVDQSSFSGNIGYEGGAIYHDNTTPLSVTNTKFTNNTAYEGGVLYDNRSTGTTMSNDDFVGNTAYDGGVAALDANSSPSYTFNNDEFDSNVATYEGVFWVEYASSLTTDNSSYIGNRGGYGAVFYLDTGAGSFEATNTTMSDNVSDFGGAINYNAPHPTSLTNDTIAFNSAGNGDGGGIYQAGDATATGGATGIRNTIIADNTGGDCGSGAGKASQFAAAADQGHNLDSDGSCFSGTGATGDKVATDPKLDPPNDNGGGFTTDALQPGSPAIDAAGPGFPATDERGVARPQGNGPDIGAYEFAAASLTLAKSAPATATQNVPFAYGITTTNHGPGPSSSTTVVDQLPAGETLYGASASQGTCTQSGSPAKVTCDLGAIANGATASVSLVVGESQLGSVTNNATVTNAQGSSASASATTLVSAASGNGTKPTATTGLASAITQHGATLTGSLTNGNQGTSYFFQIGTSTAYGLASNIQSTTTSQSVSVPVNGLAEGTVYHYRLVAVNGSGFAYGADRVFRTQGRLAPGLSLRIKSARAARLPYRYTFAGKVLLPRGVSKDKGCRGTVAVQVKAGKKTISTRHVAVKRNCTFSSSVTFSLKYRLKAPGHLKVRAHFTGNSVLAQAYSKSIRARFGR